MEFQQSNWCFLLTELAQNINLLISDQYKTWSKNYEGYVGIIIQGGSVKPRTAADRRALQGRRLNTEQKNMLYVSPFSKHVQER